MADRKSFAWVKSGILAVFQVFAVLFVFSGSFPEAWAQGAVANTTTPIIVGGSGQPPAIAPVVPRLVFPGSGEPQGTWRLEFPVISDEPIDAVTLTVSVGGEWLREDQSSITVTTLGETEKTSSYLITFSPLSETVSGAVSYWLDYADRSGDRGVPAASAKVLTLEHRNGCGVETDGEIFCWGTPFPEPDLEGNRVLPPPEGGDFVAITSNVVFPRFSNYCAITDTGQADCWGTEYGDYTDPGASINRPYPLTDRYRSVASVFAVGPRGTCAVRDVEIASPGSIVCKGDSPGSSLPVPPPGDFLSVTGGAATRACALDREGKAVCWNSAGSVSSNTPADKRFSALAIGGGGACGIQIEEDAKPGGALACWGGGYGTIPAERFLNITANNNLYCGITVEYRMRCWGGAGVPGSGDFPAPSAGTTLVAVAMSGAGSGSAGEWACAVGGSGTAECWGDDNAAGRLTGASGRHFGAVISLDPPLITSLRHTGSSGRISFFDVHLDFPGSLYINFVQEGGSTPTADEVVRRVKAGSLLALRRSFESGGAKTLRLPYLGEGNFRAYFVTENALGSRVLSTIYWTAAQFLGEEPPLLFADKGALPGSRNIDLYARLGEKFTMEFETVSSEIRVTPTVWIGGIRIPATLVTVTGQFPTQDDGHNDGSYVVAVETTVVEGVQGAVTYRVEYANQQGMAGVPVFTPQYISGGSGFYCVLLFDGKVKCMGLVPPVGRFRSIEAASNRICGIRFDGTAHCWGGVISLPAPAGSSFRSIAVAADAGCGLDIHGFAEGFCTSISPGVTVDDFEQSDIFRYLDIGVSQPCGLKPDGRIECSKFGTRNGMFELGAGAKLSMALNYMVVPQSGNSVCGIKREDKSVVCSDGRVALPASQSGSQIEYLTFAANATGSCGIALDGENANRLACKGAGSNSAPGLEGGEGEYVSVGLYYPSRFGLPPVKACGVTKLGDLRCQDGSPLTFEGLQKVGFYVDGVLPKLVDKDFPSVFKGNVTVSFAPSELSTVYAVFTEKSDLTDADIVGMSAPMSLSTSERFEKTYSSAGDAVARDYYFYVVQDDAVLNRSFFRSTMRDIGSSPTIVDGTTLTQIYTKETAAKLILRASDPNPNEVTSLIWSLGVADIPAGTTVVFVTGAGSSSTARGATVVVLFERPEGSTASASFEVKVKDPEGNTDSLMVKFQDVDNQRPMFVGLVNGQLEGVVGQGSTTMLLTFEAYDPEDASSLRWALESTADLSGGTVGFFGSTRGTSVAVVFRRTVGATVLGSFVLKVMDDLTASTAVVNLINGFSPQIDGETPLERLVNGEESAVSLSASDPDTEPENLIWSIVGTLRELTVGTTVSFVTDTGSSLTARGGTVVLLFERPERSTAGASVVVLVRDQQNNTARVVVEFRHGPSPAIAPVVPRLVLPGSGEPQGTWRLEFPVISDEPIDAVTLTVSVGGEWLREDQSSITVTTLGETEKTSSYLITFSPLSETVSGAVSYWLDYADRSGDRGVPAASAKVLTLEHRNGCGVETDGEIFCWGTPFPEPDLEGNPVLPPPEGGDFVAITSNVVFPRFSNYCAITDTGQADCWGTEYGDYTDPGASINRPYPLTDRYRSVASVFAVGSRGTCAVRDVEIASPGSIVCKGGSPGDSLPVPPLGDFLSVTGGAATRACALDREGKAVCWNSVGSVSSNTPADKRFSALAIGGDGACGIQIEEDAKPGGALACWGGGYGTIPAERFLNITANNNLYCGITVEYRMRCWGGAGVPGSEDFPAPSAGTTLVAVAMSGAGSGSNGEWACAVGGSGTAECWGDDNTAGRLTGASGRHFGTVISLDPPLITSLRHTGSSGRISFFDVHLDFPGSLYINFVQEGGSTPTADEVVRRVKAGSLLALRRSFESGGAKTLRLPYLGEGNFRAYFVTENALDSRVLSTLYWTAAQFSGEEPPLLFADKGALPGSRNIGLYARLGEKFTMEFETVSSEIRVTPTVWIGGIRVPATLVTVTGQFPTQDDGHNDVSYVVAVETTVVEGVQGAVTYRIEYANQQGMAGVPVFTPQYISGGGGFYCVLLFDGKVKCMGVAPPVGRFRSIEAASNRICGIRFDGTAHCWGGVISLPAPAGSSLRSIAVAADAGCGLDIHGFAEGFCTSINPGVTVDDFEQSDIFRDLDIGVSQPCGLKPDGRVECSKFGTRNGMFELGAGAKLSMALNYMVVPQSGNSVCGIKREDKSVVCSDGRVALPVSQSGSQIEYLTFAANATGSCGIALAGENANRLVCKGGDPAPGLGGGDGEYVSVGLYRASISSSSAKACGVTKLGDLRCQGGSPLTFEGLQKVGFYVDGVLPKLVDKDFPFVFRGNVTVSFAPSELSTVYAVFTDRSDLTDADIVGMGTPVSLSTSERFEKTYSSADDAVTRDYYFYVVQEDAVLNRSFFRSTMRETGSSPKIVVGSTLSQIYTKEMAAELILRASDPNPNEVTSLIWSLGVADIPEGTTVVFVTDTGSSSTARGGEVVLLFERPKGSTAGASVEVEVRDPQNNTARTTVQFEHVPNRKPVIVDAINGELVEGIRIGNGMDLFNFQAYDADPGDTETLVWSLDASGLSTGVTVEFPGDPVGESVAVSIMRDPVVITGLGFFVLKVSDLLSTTTATVAVILGSKPVIEGGASSVKSLIYAKHTTAGSSLTATLDGVQVDVLLWSIASTDTGTSLPTGTTVGFVLENDSRGSTVRGGEVVLLFERPKGSTAGASVEVEVRDPQNNTARTTVQFEHVPNRKPVIVDAINGELVEGIRIGNGMDLFDFQAYDADPGDTETLVWSLDASGLSTGVTVEFPGDPVGESVAVSIMRDPEVITGLGFFVLKVSDLLSTTTATVAVILGSKPVIEGGASSVKSLIYAKHTTAGSSLTATLDGVQVDVLLWSIASTDTGTSLPTGTTVGFVLENDSRGSTVRGGEVVLLFERPKGSTAGASVEVEVRDPQNNTARTTVQFEHVPNRKPVIVDAINGELVEDIRIGNGMDLFDFQAYDADPGDTETLVWSLDASGLSTGVTVEFPGDPVGESVAVSIMRDPVVVTGLGFFVLKVSDLLSTTTATVAVILGLKPVIEGGASSVKSLIYAKHTTAGSSLTATLDGVQVDVLLWSIASADTGTSLPTGTTVGFVLENDSRGSTVRGGTVVLLFERPKGSTAGASVEVEVRDPQNNTARTTVQFEHVPNRKPVIVGAINGELVEDIRIGNGMDLFDFQAYDADPGDTETLIWSLDASGLSTGVTVEFPGDPVGESVAVSIMRDPEVVTGLGFFVLEVSDLLSTTTATVAVILGLKPVIEGGASSVKSLIYAKHTTAGSSLTATLDGVQVDVLLWSIASTDTGTSLPTGTTVGFVTDTGSSSTARGGDGGLVV